MQSKHVVNGKLPKNIGSGLEIARKRNTEERGRRQRLSAVPLFYLSSRRHGTFSRTVRPVHSPLKPPPNRKTAHEILLHDAVHAISESSLKYRVRHGCIYVTSIT